MKMEHIRYYISKCSIYIFLFCFLFLVQRAVLMAIFDIKKYTIFNYMYVYEIVLAIISFVEVRYSIKMTKQE